MNHLEKIGDMLEHNVHNFTPQHMQQRITDFVEHLHREDHFDDEGHQDALESLEKAKAAGLAGMPHFRIASKPSFLQGRNPSEKQPSLWDTPTENEEKAALWQAAVNDDARAY